MQQETKRRAFLGGLAVAGVGGAGYLLRPRESERVRWLHPVEALAESDTFAYVGGVRRDSDDTMHVEVAMRQNAHDRREIVLFADSGQPIRSGIPGLRCFWRFDAAIGDRPPGTYTLVVGDQLLPIELDATLPAHLQTTRLELSPIIVWQSKYIAHARGYDTGPETGRLEISFRQPIGRGPGVLDSVAFQNPDGEIIGERTLSRGPQSVTLDLDPFVEFEANGVLLSRRDGTVVDEVDLFYH